MAGFADPNCRELKLADAPFGCLEFVFFRYQTFIAGVLALGAAMWASMHVREQIKQGQRQNSAIAAGVLRTKISELNDLQKCCAEAYRSLEKIEDLARRCREKIGITSSVVDEAFANHTSDIEDRVASLLPWKARFTPLDPMIFTISSACSGLHSCRIRARQARHVPDDKIYDYLNEFLNSLPRGYGAVGQAMTDVEQLKRKIWAEILRLEQASIE